MWEKDRQLTPRARRADLAPVPTKQPQQGQLRPSWQTYRLHRLLTREYTDAAEPKGNAHTHMCTRPHMHTQTQTHTQTDIPETDDCGRVDIADLEGAGSPRHPAEVRFSVRAVLGTHVPSHRGPTAELDSRAALGRPQLSARRLQHSRRHLGEYAPLAGTRFLVSRALPKRRRTQSMGCCSHGIVTMI